MSCFTRANVAKKSVPLALVVILSLAWGPERARSREAKPAKEAPATATPIKHLVVIFQENVSFDHYFATYPNASNPSGEPAFTAAAGTPTVNGLAQGLLTNNPNSAQPFRLDRSQNYTCDQNHDYGPEQQAADSGLMDKFVQFVGVGGTCSGITYNNDLTMGYYDGNTVTALWEYANHFAMNDNSFNTTFGPSTPGVLNLVSGQTGGVDPAHSTGDTGSVIGGTVIGDPDPFYDDCGSFEPIGMLATNTTIGDLLTAGNITWGWFQGGFKPSVPADLVHGTPAVCGTQTPRLDGTLEKDYSAHHEGFEYFASTSNPHHLPPTDVSTIGKTDQANHQYDLSDFWNAVYSGQMPAVSFLKAKRSQDGHPGYSSPLDEQIFIVNTINALQQIPEWRDTAVIIAYDDSDGWYDHVMSPIINQSATSADALTAPGNCGAGTSPLGGIQGRCGYGPRLPLLLVSRWAKANFVDNTLTDQSSILRFIEDNWLNGQRIGGGSFDAIAGTLNNMFNFGPGPHPHKLFLDPNTGEPVTN